MISFLYKQSQQERHFSLSHGCTNILNLTFFPTLIYCKKQERQE